MFFTTFSFLRPAAKSFLSGFFYSWPRLTTFHTKLMDCNRLYRNKKRGLCRQHAEDGTPSSELSEEQKGCDLRFPVVNATNSHLLLSQIALYLQQQSFLRLLSDPTLSELKKLELIELAKKRGYFDHCKSKNGLEDDVYIPRFYKDFDW